MSDIARPKTGGDKLAAEEINADLPVVVNSGETINGATLPVAVFMDDTADELLACDADDSARLQFDGFAISNSTNGNPITLQKDGVVDGFTGLDIGKKYYVQDDKTIGTAIGTNPVLVGVAISATQILIIKNGRMATGSISQFTRDDDASGGTEDQKTTIGFNPKYLILEIIGGSNGAETPKQKSVIHKHVATEIGITIDENSIIVIYAGTTVVGTGGFINGSLEILSVDSTGFTLRVTWGGTFGGGGSRTVTFDADYIAIE